MHYVAPMQRATKMMKVNSLLKQLKDIGAARMEAVQELGDQLSALELAEHQAVSDEIALSNKADIDARRDKFIDCIKALDELEKRRQDAISALSAAA